ncbi:MAG: CoA transferase, partial [Alphaproteobacteria bacterium]|nr:CoA transferase [Alphaproteobacteria bacterium]
PVRAGIPIADLTAGLFAALGILTALHEREVSGEGQWLETSLLAAQIFMLDFQASRWTMDREVPQQAGNDHPTSIPTGVFKTADGHINIAAAGGAIWQRLCDALGTPDMATRPGFATASERSKNRVEVNRAIEAITVGTDSATWIARLNAAGVPCGEINSIDKVFADPQVKHLGLEQTFYSKTLGDIALVAQPVKLKRTPSRFVVAPPERGEHTREILADLGYSDAVIDDLARRNIV